MDLATFAAIAAVAGPVVLGIGGWFVNKRINRANANKANAETKVAEATADKTAADVQTVILANTKQLLAEARAVQSEKDAVKDERIRQLNGRVNRMENRFESMRAALATHGVWDASALIDLRDVKPEYPPPPPFPINALGGDYDDGSYDSGDHDGDIRSLTDRNRDDDQN